MKKVLFSLTFITVIFLCSCSKENNTFNKEIIGRWIWQSSHSSDNQQIVLVDTTEKLELIFNTDFSFSNAAFCATGGPFEGTFQTRASGNDKLLILKSIHNEEGNFKIRMSNNKLTLIASVQNNTWYHDFYMK